MKELRKQIRESFESLKSQCKFEKEKLLVIGCSSSEVMGSKIGTNSNYEIGETISKTLIELCEENKLYMAAQCCEHLNRALVVERNVAEKFNFEIVTVVPKPKAGGSFATASYSLFKDPVVVEFIKADYGLDIGLTMIGMHMKHVCIPLRIKPDYIGEAKVTGARIRPKLIGGERAEYK
ncbi:TIGR01440 family protein [Miniphocaeibacter massiliensis]|uniref:TIGR01440 family protein n=1 Tax=Miniphocaeibacter massiliensis TaxID=2041841 RepID=UPI000C1C79A2|nr:TIGR01440 family protein [Miniphocaeibacter massiliensis]